MVARMNRILMAALILVACAGVAQAKPVPVNRNAGESDTDFVQRVTKQTIVPDEAEHPQIANTTALIPGAQVLVAFTEAADPQDPSHDYDIMLNVFLKTSDRSYSWIGNTDACEIEGGSATQRAFFYASPDNGPTPDVAVICGWDATHRGADCESNDEVRFFKVDRNDVSDVDMKKYQTLFYKQVKPDRKSAYTCQVSKFKTAADVKKLLKAGR
jgi:hypothetical protein